MEEVNTQMAENILVVDDEREIADLVEVYLQNEGYTVYKFYNAGDALNCLEKHQLVSPYWILCFLTWMDLHFAEGFARSFIFPLLC